MPELPEVEVVRRGLADHVVGRRIADVQFYGARVTRRHQPGPIDLADQVRGARVAAARRRGKYLWLELEPDLQSPEEGAQHAAGSGATLALLAHLGMSGQLLIHPGDSPDEKHLHARFSFADGGPELRFVDQRTFGGFALSEVETGGLPIAIGHIAADPFDADFRSAQVAREIRSRRSAIKRVLLDQRVVSGIGNIYADEALWRAQVHGERIASSLTGPAITRLLEHSRAVMLEALDQGGTSFDTLYVNVNGASGYFDRRLAVYGREGEPCPRCGTPIRRTAFMNRSSHFCPRCQRVPRPRLG